MTVVSLIFLLAVGWVGGAMGAIRESSLTRLQLEEFAQQGLNSILGELRTVAKPMIYGHNNADYTRKTSNGIIFLRQFKGSDDCSGEHIRDMVFFHENPNFYLDNTNQPINRVQYGCSIESGEVWVDFCSLSDPQCDVPLMRASLVDHKGQCTNSRFSSWSLLGSCKKDSSFMKGLTGRDMAVGYSSLSSLRTHDLTQAIHIHIHQNNHHIINLSLMDSGMECNQNIVGGGVCVDTRYIRSLAYIPMSFTGGRVYTYTSYNGDGEMTITTYEEPIHTHKLGAYTTYTTYRHTVGNWYAQAFTSHTHSHTHTHIEDHTHQQYTHTHTHTHTHTGTPPGVYVSTNTAPNSTHCATCAPYTSGSSHMFGM